MFARLNHVPPKMIWRIPGPPPIGSRRATVQWGLPVLPFNGSEGVPDGAAVLDWWNQTGEPTWFAISDYGAGYIPWGFWQVVLYPTGTAPGNPPTLAYREMEVDVSQDGQEVCAEIYSALNAFQGTAIVAGYGAAAGFSFEQVFMHMTNPLSAGVVIRAPWGLRTVADYFSGKAWARTQEQDPMIEQTDGYENPLFLALWAPGSRAAIPTTPQDELPVYPYPGYPYPRPPSPPSPRGVDLRTAANYEVLAKTGITNVPTSAITGDLGVSPAAASTITGFALALDGSGEFSTSAQVTGRVYAADYSGGTPAALTQAVLDMQAAYTDAAGRTPDTTNYFAGLLNGQTLVPGVYKWTTGVSISGDITLHGDASSVFVFQIAGNLTLAANKTIILSGGGGVLPANVFWQVAGNVAIGANANFSGQILCFTDITLGAGAILTGRCLSQTAANFNSDTLS